MAIAAAAAAAAEVANQRSQLRVTPVSSPAYDLLRLQRIRFLHHSKEGLAKPTQTLEKLTMRPCLTTKIFATLCLVAILDLHGSEAIAQHSPTESASVDNELLRGQWKGTWVSCKSGHTGRLNATFCRLNSTQVEAKFTGSFAKIFPFRYKATLDIVHEADGVIKLRGSRKLGPLMGTFSYEATVTADQFRATYRSKRDCGQWNMNRVACSGS